MAVVIQRWELSGDFCVSGDQHWWEYCITDTNTQKVFFSEYSNKAMTDFMYG